MSLSLSKNVIYTLKNQGIFTVIFKGAVSLWSRVIQGIGSHLYEINSTRYWGFLMKYDRLSSRGRDQTMYFAAAMFANINYDQIKDVTSVIDFGCAMGDSSIIIKTFLPKANIFLHDISDVGVKKAISKYSKYFNVSKHIESNKYDLVYSSNVIEHVNDPDTFVHNLISLSKKYIVIQCPWNELHPVNGNKISPDNPNDEHMWTIDDNFFNKYIKNDLVEWTLTKGEVPIAWGGTQAFFFGKIRSELTD